MRPKERGLSRAAICPFLPIFVLLRRIIYIVRLGIVLATYDRISTSCLSEVSMKDSLFFVKVFSFVVVLLVLAITCLAAMPSRNPHSIEFAWLLRHFHLPIAVIALAMSVKDYYRAKKKAGV